MIPGKGGLPQKVEWVQENGQWLKKVNGKIIQDTSVINNVKARDVAGAGLAPAEPLKNSRSDLRNIEQTAANKGNPNYKGGIANMASQKYFTPQEMLSLGRVGKGPAPKTKPPQSSSNLQRID